MKRAIRGGILVIVCHACVFEGEDFARTADLGDGEIRARFARDDGKPASGALVAVHGSARTGAADENGAVVVKELFPGTWLLKITEDDEGDGIADRGLWQSVSLELAEIPRNLTDGCTGPAPQGVTSVLLGDPTPLTLPATGSLAGTLTVPAGQQGRVVVTRDVEGYATSVEGAAGVATDGTWRIDGLIAGDVRVTAFIFDPLEGPTLPLTFGTATATVGDEDLALTADDDARLDGGGLRLASSQFEAQWSLLEVDAVSLNQTSYLTPGAGSLIGVPDETQVELDDATRAFVLDPPVGVIDVLFSSATTGASGGLLRNAVVTPETGLTLGPVDLPILGDACLTEDEAGAPLRDCDRDGLEGLPAPSGFDDDAYALCAEDCAGSFGVANAQDVCGNFDCDDDGDGQPDVTEPPACIGPGLGTDLDEDNLCEPGQDPFPFCDAADLAGCPAAFTQPSSRY